MTKTQNSKSVPARWSTARTAAELRAAIEGIDAEIESAQAEVKRLEEERTSVVLSGGSLTVHSQQLFEAGERVKAFTAAREDVQRRLSGAAVEERETTFRNWSKKAHEIGDRELQDAWREHERALRQTARTLDRIQEIETQIRNLQWPIEEAKRKELLYSLPSARAAVSDEIGRPPVPADAVGIRQSDDLFAILGKQIIERLNLVCVHEGDRHRAARSNVLFNIDTGTPDRDGAIRIRRVPSTLPKDAA